ncbi:helix-turn-helix domain-containing protein [Sphingobium baderi]|uniref:HTH cro/C1-type domain-containing protein n=1 Tax=Sphingobium baderi TaxID=1332080 RepID=A0A0S3F645_9SPHN|nr:helix-turn-helix transcriptional regulator [Sphingobium baderi]ALR23155.1 hypothetical protein ATN00_21895 [Sphingobium baderi]
MANREIKLDAIAEASALFGRNFREARQAAGLSQQAVHAETGLAQSFISDVERGKSTISLDNAAYLANCVRVPLWKLLED